MKEHAGSPKNRMGDYILALNDPKNILSLLKPQMHWILQEPLLLWGNFIYGLTLKTLFIYIFITQLAASCVQSRQLFARTLPEQLFELKNEDAIKKSENLHDTCPC